MMLEALVHLTLAKGIVFIFLAGSPAKEFYTRRPHHLPGLSTTLSFLAFFRLLLISNSCYMLQHIHDILDTHYSAEIIRVMSPPALTAWSMVTVNESPPSCDAIVSPAASVTR